MRYIALLLGLAAAPACAQAGDDSIVASLLTEAVAEARVAARVLATLFPEESDEPPAEVMHEAQEHVLDAALAGARSQTLLDVHRALTGVESPAAADLRTHLDLLPGVAEDLLEAEVATYPQEPMDFGPLHAEFAAYADHLLRLADALDSAGD